MGLFEKDNVVNLYSNKRITTSTDGSKNGISYKTKIFLRKTGFPRFFPTG